MMGTSSCVLVYRLMKRIRTTFLMGVVAIAASVGTSAQAQPPTNIKYKITWEGPKDTQFGGAYAVMQPDGTTTSKSFDGTFPMKMEFMAPASATITASGGSLTQNIQVTVRVHRGDKLCDEAVANGRGVFATADCEPPMK
jgi:hypothetical protein